jgi:hypothetical protein
MDAQDLVAAYRPFVESLLTGGSDEPSEGWDAALPGAHAASNSERIAVLADRDLHLEQLNGLPS